MKKLLCVLLAALMTLTTAAAVAEGDPWGSMQEGWNQFTQGLGSWLSQTGEDIGEWIGQAGEDIGSWFAGVGEFWGGKLDTATTWLKENYSRISGYVVDKANVIQRYVTERGPEVSAEIQEAWATLLQAASRTGQVAKEKAQEAYQTLREWLKSVDCSASQVENTAGQVSDTLQDAQEALDGLAQQAGLDVVNDDGVRR